MSRPRALGALALALYLCVALAMHVQADFGPAQGAAGSGDITAVLVGTGLAVDTDTGDVTITLDEELVDVAGVTPTADQFLGGTGSALAMRTASQVRASIGLATTDSPEFAAAVLTEAAAPGTPAAGKVTVYAKTDGLLYSKDDAGTETLVSGGSGIGGSTGATDNAILRADGTGGATAQSSAVTIADTSGDIVTPGKITAGSTAMYMWPGAGWFGLTSSHAVVWGDAGPPSSGATIRAGLGSPAVGTVSVIGENDSGCGAFLARVVYEVHASDDTLTESESGSTHTNSGAATRTLTLPTVAVAGVRFSFVALVSGQVLNVDPGASEKFIGFSAGTADGEYLSIAANGAMEVVSQADGDWVVTYTRGTVTEETP